MFGRGGGSTVVRAAQKFGVAHMLSSGCTPLETVAAAAPNALRMAQLYVRADDRFVQDYVTRVVACGCAAFCLTLDTAVSSRRERYRQALSHGAGSGDGQAWSFRLRSTGAQSS